MYSQFSLKLLLYQLWSFVGELAAGRRTPEFYAALGNHEVLLLMGTWFYVLTPNTTWGALKTFN